jgi:RuvC endonuclease subdomain 3/HNH endonuclease
MMNPSKSSISDFCSGLVFGFDVGTGSIGYAVRKGSEFLDVGVLICPKDTNDLSGRRALRRQRRTLRSRKHRRQWFAKELEQLGLPRPQKPTHDPITLRVRALNGEAVQPDELHAALAHLFKRRGYTKVPWASEEATGREKQSPKEDEEGEIKKAVGEIRRKVSESGCQYPCQFLAKRREEVGKSPTEKWARKIYWPREMLQDEFLAILKAQAKRSPKVADKADWLLFGDTREVRGCRVFFNATGSRNPGALGLRWPRFDNRSPALDSFQPVDEQGRTRHVVRKNKEAFTKTQWELALMNFRVLDAATRQKLDPRTCFPIFVGNLRNEWNKKGKVTAARLEKLAEPFKAKFFLIEGQKPLTPDTGMGRSRYSSPTLEMIRSEIGAGRRVDPPQPNLRREGESADEALNRYLADIKHPLVRHRLVLFRRLLARLAARFGPPDMVVLEAVRSLALGQRAKNELNKRNEKFRKERELARDQLSSSGESISRKAIQRYRLWQEAKHRCPFCLEDIERADLGHGADIEHLVPRSIVDCNEFYNLTVAHLKCNRELKGERTPFGAFHDTPLWADIQRNAEQTFSGRKLEIFLSPNAEELIEQKADLQHTAYIARVIRHVALVQLGWLNDEGRDPTPEKQNSALRFQVTNGQLTSRLRRAWGLNQILHPLPPGKRWDDLTLEEQTQFAEKNRGDLRHHALDAMVIACTLPWLAHRTHGATDELGNHGWWTQDEKLRSKAANPVFPREGQLHEVAEREIGKVVVQHHISHSNHQQAYATTLYAKKAKDTYVARKVFTKLTPRNLGSIWPKEFAAYCEAAWARYATESPEIELELRQHKGYVPASFTTKLCFAHFQQWRAEQAPPFAWPEQIKIPIRSVRLISVKDDTAVVPFSRGTHAYVRRTGFKEVPIYPAEDGKGFVPVFVPYSKADKPVSERPIPPGAKPVAVIRKGQIINLVKPLGAGAPAGKYRVLVMGQEQIKLLPPHVANKDEAKIAFRLPKSGLQPYWPEFIRCLGHELPHPPPA